MLKSKFQKVSTVLLVGFLIATSSFVRPPKVFAANDPFVCSPAFYQVISGQLKILNPVTGLYQDIGPANSTYNAIGYNPEDNYIYGILSSGLNTGNIVRIASDGTLTDLGAATGLPANNYITADFDNAGNLLIRSAIDTIRKVDISAMTSTTLNLTGDPITGADAVFINNHLYLLQDQTLSDVDLNTNIAVTRTISSLPALGDYGAGWTDQDGRLYFSRNSAGEIYEITDFTTATPTATFQISGAVTNVNDGASCPNAASALGPPTAIDDTYTTPFNTALDQTTSVMTNDIGYLLSVTAHTSPSHGLVTIPADGSFVYTPTTGYSGIDTFTYTVTDNYGRTAIATVTITVSPLADSSSINGASTTTLASTGTTSTLPALMSIGLITLTYLFDRASRRQKRRYSIR